VLARKLRNNSTLSEVILWKHLNGKQMMGYDFHRQKPLHKYIVDFFCNELMLAIEIDGYTHQFEEVFKKDELRQKDLEYLGIKFLRFHDGDVKNDLLNVLRTIEGWIREHTPNPSQEGNRTR
jgi:very-short-patch-repair endonuclease